MSVFVNSTRELEDILKNNEILIYGTGYLAKRFYKYLESTNLDNNCKNFISTFMVDNEIEGKSTCLVDDIEKRERTIICIAVHEILKDEIIQTLQERELDNFVWITPYLLELEFGNPKKINCKVELKRIIENSDYRYLWAIRWLAIDNYYNRNNFGYDYYLRVQCMYSNEDTAKKRLKQFKIMIQNWEVHGYNSKFKIKINENYEIIDGLHRCALACYHGLFFINADIFSNEKKIIDIAGERAIPKRQQLLKAGFLEEDVKRMDEMFEKIVKDMILY